MKNTSLSTLLIVSVIAFSLISCGGGSSSKKKTSPTGGDGGAGDPITYTCTDTSYEPVHDVASLKAISDNMAGNYCLAKDIDLSQAGGESDFPLGWRSNSDITSFTGNFDGQNKTISNLVINADASGDLGLFAKIGGDTLSEIKDLELANFKVKGDSYVGALAGFAAGNMKITNVTVTNVASEAKSISTSYVGGLIGNISATSISITDSGVTGTVQAMGPHAGGLVGSLTGASITKSYSKAAVTASDNVGGLVGSVDNSAATAVTIEKSYATGAVSGESSIGGLVGHLKGKIDNSYALGAVIASVGEVGGVVGLMTSGSVSNAYAIGAVSGTSKGGVIGKFAGTGTVTNSYFDLEATTATSAIGEGTITPTPHAGVANKGDISEDTTTTPVVYRTVALPQNIIFDGWVEANWKFAEANWPILKWQSETLTAGDVNVMPLTCANTAYTPINDIAELKLVANDMAGNYCLVKDIDLAGVADGFPLGWKTGGNSIIPFTGNFDGENHTISNLTINKPTSEHIGLFAKLKDNSIKDLNLVDFKVTGRSYVGSLAGSVDDGHNNAISNVQVKNPIIDSQGHMRDPRWVTSYAGGLIGSIRAATVTNSSIIGGTVSGKGHTVGGLLGDTSGEILNSYATCAVNGDSSSVGGLLGSGLYITISNSYATGDVGGKDEVGGLVGQIHSTGGITNSYATGMVTASSDKGGLIGKLNNCKADKCNVTNSYFDKSGTNSGINAIGAGVGTIIGLVDVNGASDIGVVAGGGFQTIASPNDKIFVGWDATIWEIMAGAWPTFLHSK